MGARFVFLYCLFLFFSLSESHGQKALNQKIDQIYATYHDQPGAMVGIWQNGKVLFEKGYGLANLEHQVPFTTYTTSDIGSVAKQLTCYAILQLEQAGKLAIDDDIRDYLPFVPDFGETITIRHLMNHTSGLREIYSTEAIRGRRSGDAMFQEDVQRLVRQQEELNFAPGAQFMYCNTSYALLSEIVEQASGQSFEAWMREQVFEPIGMTNTYIMDRQGEVFPQMAASYNLQSDSVYTKEFDNNTIRGQGGVYSCLEDMMQWMGYLAKMQQGGSIVMEKMTERTVLNNGDTTTYAKGLYVDTFRGMDRIFHTGSSAAYRSAIIYFPVYDLGVFINTNAPNVPLYETMDVIIEHFLEDYIQDTPRGAGTGGSPKATFVSKKDKSYAGVYFSPELEVSYTVYWEGEQLRVKSFRNGVYVLEPETEDRFTSQAGFFPRVQFERNGKKEVVGLRVSTSRAKGIRFVKHKK